MKRFNLNIHYFADVMNKTTSAASGNKLTDEIKTYYSDYLIDLAEPELVHDQFGQKKPIPAGNGKKIEFRKWTKLPTLTQPISEGVTPDGQALDVSIVDATVAQYGGYVKVTDMLELTAIDPVIVEALKLIGQQAGRTLDTITREVIAGGSNFIVANGKTRSTLTASDKLTVQDIKKAVRNLKRQDAPTINGSYVGIIHPDIAYDLMNDPEFLAVTQYGDPSRHYNNEIGKIANVRFVESTNAKVFKGEGASSADVYATMIIGEGAYGVTEITGGGLQTIVHDKASAGGALEQWSTVGWKATKVAERLVEQYMVRIESGATA